VQEEKSADVNQKFEQILSKVLVFGEKITEKIEVAVDAVLNKIDGIEELDAVRQEQQRAKQSNG
jgi:hypothetical protein